MYDLTEIVQKGKKESEQVLSNSNLNKKDFRVYYGILETEEDCKSPSYGTQKNRPIPLSEEQSKRKSDIDIYKEMRSWFQNLSIDERVNALTTTCPFLAQSISSMKTIIKN